MSKYIRVKNTNTHMYLAGMMSEGEISILQSLLSMDVLDYALIVSNKSAFSND